QHPAGSILPIKDEVFSYDAVGNRLADAQISGYTYDQANGLASNSSFTYAYDSDGDLTSKTQGSTPTAYTYDSMNQLSVVTLPNGTTWSYKYDGTGRRVEKSTGTGVGQGLSYIYDEQNLLAVLDESNNPIIVYTNGLRIDEPLLVHRSETDYSIHSDALGSVRVHASTDGYIVEDVRYSAYGLPVYTNARSVSPSSWGPSMTGSSICFVGRECDSESQLISMRQRQTYSPIEGKFFQQDPVGFVGGIN